MKKVLIQGAMLSEISYYLEQNCFENVQEVNIHGFSFYQATTDDMMIWIQLTKMGMIHATMATMTALYEFMPDLVINQGTAGAQVRELTRGDVIIGEQAVDVHSLQMPARDFGEGMAPSDWQGMHTEYISADENLVRIFQKEIPRRIDSHAVMTGILGTGDLFSKEKDRIIWLHDKFNHLSEDMESYAVYKVCREFGVPCISIRVISNNELNGEEFDSITALELQRCIWDVLTQGKTLNTERLGKGN